jgi:hypothetical protein
MNESMTFFYAALREFRREVALKNLKKSSFSRRKSKNMPKIVGEEAKKQTDG